MRIEMMRGREPRERVLIGDGGVAVGPAGGRLARILYPSLERTSDLRSFVRTYAPFRMRAPGGVMAFRGRGGVRPSPVERRMIAEWTRQVAAEAAGRRSADTYGLSFAWHRGTTGVCDDVAVYLSGEVRASSCGWGTEISGRLAPGPLGQLYEWFDRLAPFQDSRGGGEGRAQPAAVRLIFAGRGRRAASAAEKEAIQGFAAALHRELAARQEAVSPAAVEKPGPAVPAGEAEAVPPEPPVPAGPPLLLPLQGPGRALRETVIPREAMPDPPPVPAPDGAQ